MAENTNIWKKPLTTTHPKYKEKTLSQCNPFSGSLRSAWCIGMPKTQTSKITTSTDYNPGSKLQFSRLSLKTPWYPECKSQLETRKAPISHYFQAKVETFFCSQTLKQIFWTTMWASPTLRMNSWLEARTRKW